jgi:hypothetical protein
MMDIKRAWEAPTRIELTVNEGERPYVNLMNLNEGDEVKTIAALIVALADETGIRPVKLAAQVMRLVSKVAFARVIVGDTTRQAEPADPAQIIEVVAVGD